MGLSGPLDVVGPAQVNSGLRHSSACGLLLTAYVLLFAASNLYPQSSSSDAQQLFDQRRWQELVQLLASSGPTAQSDYYLGIAYANLGKLDDAKRALASGAALAPRDKRFPIELAGIAFKQKKATAAKRFLHQALRIDPKDAYAQDFLATLYFVDGNLQAALKHWQSIGKPYVDTVHTPRDLRVRPALLDHAFAFAPRSVLTSDQLLTSDRRLSGLEIFSSHRFDLVALPEGKFDVDFRAQERNGFGSTKLEVLTGLLAGLPFQEITPEYYNLHGAAINLRSLIRWDPDNRRGLVTISAPLAQDPRWRVILSADGRNENWDLRSSFTGPAPILAALNIRRESLTAQVRRFAGPRTVWTAGLEFSHRDFRSLFQSAPLTAELLDGNQIKQIVELQYGLYRSPEHRFTLMGTAHSEASRLWASSASSSEKLQPSLQAHWLPQARTDDFETVVQLRGARTWGNVPFDELFMLGLERDNDLLMRAHIGSRHGRKGSAPLGKNFGLINWETDKNVYSNGLFTFKLGPFVDTGKITGLASTLASSQWLADVGGQGKLKAFGIGVVFSYGKDTRTGNNAFYARLGH